MYRVIRRNPNTWREFDGHREYEVMGVGNEYEDLVEALVESNARSLLEGEGTPQWNVESDYPADNEIDHETGRTPLDNEIDAISVAGSIDEEMVYNFLVEQLEIGEAEAAKLVS